MSTLHIHDPGGGGGRRFAFSEALNSLASPSTKHNEDLVIAAAQDDYKWTSTPCHTSIMMATTLYQEPILIVVAAASLRPSKLQHPTPRVHRTGMPNYADSHTAAWATVVVKIASTHSNYSTTTTQCFATYEAKILPQDLTPAEVVMSCLLSQNLPYYRTAGKCPASTDTTAAPSKPKSVTNFHQCFTLTQQLDLKKLMVALTYVPRDKWTALPTETSISIVQGTQHNMAKPLQCDQGDLARTAAAPPYTTYCEDTKLKLPIASLKEHLTCFIINESPEIKLTAVNVSQIYAPSTVNNFALFNNKIGSKVTTEERDNEALWHFPHLPSPTKPPQSIANSASTYRNIKLQLQISYDTVELAKDELRYSSNSSGKQYMKMPNLEILRPDNSIQIEVNKGIAPFSAPRESRAHQFTAMIHHTGYNFPMANCFSKTSTSANSSCV